MDSHSDGPVNYDSAPILELEIEGVDYRLDSGKQGTALCISTRASGSWGWAFAGEARWDGDLRSKAFERQTLVTLSKAFREALRNIE